MGTWCLELLGGCRKLDSVLLVLVLPIGHGDVLVRNPDLVVRGVELGLVVHTYFSNGSLSGVFG